MNWILFNSLFNQYKLKHRQNTTPELYEWMIESIESIEGVKLFMIHDTHNILQIKGGIMYHVTYCPPLKQRQWEFVIWRQEEQSGWQISNKFVLTKVF